MKALNIEYNRFHSSVEKYTEARLAHYTTVDRDIIKEIKLQIANLEDRAIAHPPNVCHMPPFQSLPVSTTQASTLPYPSQSSSTDPPSPSSSNHQPSLPLPDPAPSSIVLPPSPPSSSSIPLAPSTATPSQSSPPSLPSLPSPPSSSFSTPTQSPVTSKQRTTYNSSFLRPKSLASSPSYQRKQQSVLPTIPAEQQHLSTQPPSAPTNDSFADGQAGASV